MKAAVLEQINVPLRICDLDSPNEKLNRGEVRVRILASGICGAQLQEIEGKKGELMHLPHLLGHEGCGIVEEVGPYVRSVLKGDKVVMHWRKGSGLDITPQNYTDAITIKTPKGILCGQVIKSGPITTFSEYSIVSENRITKIPNEVPNCLAALLGCALSTGLSIVDDEIFGDDQRILVVGCGGVGLCLIFASLMQTDHVCGIDLSDKKELVHSLGATFCSAKTLQGIGEEYDLIFDTTGACCFGHRLAADGIYVVVGQTDRINMYLPKFFEGKDGQIIKSTQAGGFNPTKDIPTYIEWWKEGDLDGYEKIITHTISLDEINKGISLMRDGKAGRVMIDMMK